MKCLKVDTIKEVWRNILNFTGNDKDSKEDISFNHIERKAQKL